MHCDRISSRSLITWLLLAFGSHCQGQKPPSLEVEGIRILQSVDQISPNEAARLTFLFLSNQPANQFLPEPEPLWCRDPLQDALKQLLANRPDLKETCAAIELRAGVPPLLAGGKRLVLPGRLLTLVANRNGQLLEVQVGVPSADELTALVEDALEIDAANSLADRNEAKVSAMVAERADETLSRLYKDALKRFRSEYRDREPFDLEKPGALAEMVTFLRDLENQYRFDVKLRYALELPGDETRLYLVEQHLEAREDWCDAVLPWIVTLPAIELIPILTECMWSDPVVLTTDALQAKTLKTWIEDGIAGSNVVLVIKPSHSRMNLPWPPMNSARPAPKGRSWTDLELAMSNHPMKEITVGQLAFLLEEMELQPIQLLSPSPVRYVVFEQGRKLPTLIRESDLPGKYIRRFSN